MALGGVPEGSVELDIPETLPWSPSTGACWSGPSPTSSRTRSSTAPTGEPVLVSASAIADRVEVRVVDRGPGVPDEAKDRIFEPFQRYGDAPRGAGVGLGLAVARGFTEAIGGTLHAEDTPAAASPWCSASRWPPSGWTSRCFRPWPGPESSGPQVAGTRRTCHGNGVPPAALHGRLLVFSRNCGPPSAFWPVEPPPPRPVRRVPGAPRRETLAGTADLRFTGDAEGAWPVDRPVTVGVDGSSASMRALDWAADEAALHGRPLRILHASVWERFEGATPAEDLPEGSAEAALLEEIIGAAAARARERRPEVGIHAEVLPGEPADVLFQAAQDTFALVVGHHGHGALARRLFTDSVGPRVAERASCPVVVVGDSVPVRPRGDRQVVLGVGEATDAAPGTFALQEAQVTGCDLVVVHARSRQEARQGSAGLRNSPAVDALLSAAVPDRVALESGVVVRRRVVDGPAPQALLRAAGHADLLVLGFRHRRGRGRRELGATHHAALRHSPCPVAFVGGPWSSP